MLSRSVWILKWVIIMIIILAKGNPPEEPLKCSNNFTNCTITNSYGTFPDRSTCHAAEAAYPSSEQDIVSIVANATRAKRKMRVATRYSHSIPKLVCPDGENGLIISTENLNRVIKIDKEKMLVTLESGVTLRQLIDEAAKSGLAFPYTPYWWGLTIGGLLGTGAHGSTLWGDGSSIHDYVVQMRIVTAGSEEDDYATVRTLEENGEFDGEMKAAKVSLGVLGVISQASGATLFNLSLLTSDMWAVVIRIFFYQQQVEWLYYVSFAVVGVGLLIYSKTEKSPNLSQEPENGIPNPQYQLVHEQASIDV